MKSAKAGVCFSPAAINARPQSDRLLILLLSLSLVFTTIGINMLMQPRCSLLQTLTVYCPNPECRTFKMLLDVVVFKFWTDVVYLVAQVSVVSPNSCIKSYTCFHMLSAFSHLQTYWIILVHFGIFFMHHWCRLETADGRVSREIRESKVLRGIAAADNQRWLLVCQGYSASLTGCAFGYCTGLNGQPWIMNYLCPYCRTCTAETKCRTGTILSLEALNFWTELDLKLH